MNEWNANEGWRERIRAEIGNSLRSSQKRTVSVISFDSKDNMKRIRAIVNTRNQSYCLLFFEENEEIKCMKNGQPVESGSIREIIDGFLDEV